MGWFLERLGFILACFLCRDLGVAVCQELSFNCSHSKGTPRTKPTGLQSQGTSRKSKHIPWVVAPKIKSWVKTRLQVCVEDTWKVCVEVSLEDIGALVHGRGEYKDGWEKVKKIKKEKKNSWRKRDGTHWLLQGRWECAKWHPFVGA